MSRIIWTLRQLLPLTYRTTYTDAETGLRRFAVWRMWLGHSFDRDDYALLEPPQ